MLDEYSTEIDMESGYQLSPTVIPATFDVNELIYVSEDPAVAKVSDSEALQKGLRGALPAISLCSQTALMTALMNDGDPSLVFAQQGVDMIKILSAIYESAESGKEILL